MAEYIEVVTTTSDEKEAKKISDEILKSKKSACVQIIGPIKSQYWWKGQLEESEEWMCVIKTKKALFNYIESAIKKLHSYEVPEIIAKDIVEGSTDYIKWMNDVIE